MASVLILHGSSNTIALAMETLLEGRGDTVTLSDDGAIPGDLSGYDVIVLADPYSGTAPTLLSSTKGIVLAGRNEWVAYGLASAVSASAGQTQIDVKSTSHDISVDAGLNSLGMVTVYTAGNTADFVSPGALATGGTRIADDATTTDNRVVLFAFEAGAALISGTAAGRRVGWGCVNAAGWNALGQDVFFAAVDWAANIQAETEFTITAEQGSYTLAGQATSLLAGGGVSAEQGTYILLGAEALRDIEIDADQGSYALNGQVTTLKSSFILGCAVGSYLLHGQSAQLVYSAAIVTAAEEVMRHFRRVAANRGFPFFGRY